MTPSVRVERDGAVATVTLSNPAKLNAITVAMWRELARAMRELSAQDELRCVVLRGAGKKAFASGADIEEFARVRNNAEQGRRYHRQDVFGALRAVDECRHPTIAMIHGPCVGGGLEIACMCDLRIAGASGRFGVPISRLGFSIAYDELAALLPLVGRAVALEILVEGRVWNAHEAYEKGLVTRVVPDARLAAEVAAAARRIAEAAPLANRSHKTMVRRLAPMPAALTDAEIDESFAYFDTEDYRIGYDAFLKKKKPKFVGR
ncbi:MAG TPA: enoyl-CoA hydratase-related protein [Burkholderiales bacterium]|nr:enoyl-CoA hydratase-related protein [Burkholderiales bacterium]